MVFYAQISGIRAYPLKYTDSDGRDDVYYDLNGNYIESITSNTNNVYARHGTGTESRNTLVASNAEFVDVTATVFGETSGNQEESNAIADVIMNRVNYTGRTIHDIVQNTGFYGYNQASIDNVNNGQTSNINSVLVSARSASIDALIGNIDSSNGSYFFEGLNFITPGSSYYNANNWYVRMGWGTTIGTESGIIHYLENIRIGGTVFMYNNPEYHGGRGYP
jgi:hypothetical protein